jgi:hypothetical protein
MSKTLEVFRDLYLRGPQEKRKDLRAALMNAAGGRWRVDLERSEEVAKGAITTDDVLLFRTQATEAYPEAGLTLWEHEDGYYVPNIVPLETGQLTHAQYNAILEDFIKEIASDTAPQIGFIISTTRGHQTIEDWVPEDAAEKLRRFSGAANKSTSASHPSDEKRWFDFIVSVHRSGAYLDADRLARWLYEVDGWDEESAHSLAARFEGAVALLKFYDEN